jgi:ELWxxDGT repeat protein
MSHVRTLAVLFITGAVTPAVTAQIFLTKDMIPGTASSAPRPSDGAILGDVLYFAGQDRRYGRELWRTDGTRAGTYMVKDLHPGGFGSPAHFTQLGDRIVFSGSTLKGRELWITDGSKSGTNVIASGYLLPTQLTLVGNEVFFVSGGNENLVRTGASAASSFLVYAKGPVRKITGASEPTAFGNRVLFSANDSKTGQELWAYDPGTGFGELIADIQTGTGSSIPSQLTRVGGLCFFTAKTTAHGNELWVTNGTKGNAWEVKDLQVGVSSSDPRHLTAVGSKLYFSASAAPRKRELFCTDGKVVTQLTKSGTVSSMEYSAPAPVRLGQDRLIFAAADSGAGTELWVTDGTVKGTTRVRDIRIGTASSNPRSLVSVGQRFVIFSAETKTAGRELWFTNGTSNLTLQAADYVGGTRGFSPKYMKRLGSQLLMQGTSPPVGSELFRVPLLAISESTQEGCTRTGQRVPHISVDDPSLGSQIRIRGTHSFPKANLHLGIGLPSTSPTMFDSCRIWLDLGNTEITVIPGVLSSWTSSVTAPASPALHGLRLGMQGVYENGSVLGTTNYVELVLGY